MAAVSARPIRREDAAAAAQVGERSRRGAPYGQESSRRPRSAVAAGTGSPKRASNRKPQCIGSRGSMPTHRNRQLGERVSRCRAGSWRHSSSPLSPGGRERAKPRPAATARRRTAAPQGPALPRSSVSASAPRLAASVPTSSSGRLSRPVPRPSVAARSHCPRRKHPPRSATHDRAGSALQPYAALPGRH